MERRAVCDEEENERARIGTFKGMCVSVGSLRQGHVLRGGGGCGQEREAQPGGEP